MFLYAVSARDISWRKLARASVASSRARSSPGSAAPLPASQAPRPSTPRSHATHHPTVWSGSAARALCRDQRRLKYLGTARESDHLARLRPSRSCSHPKHGRCLRIERERETERASDHRSMLSAGHQRTVEYAPRPFVGIVRPKSETSTSVMLSQIPCAFISVEKAESALFTSVKSSARSPFSSECVLRVRCAHQQTTGRVASARGGEQVRQRSGVVQCVATSQRHGRGTRAHRAREDEGEGRTRIRRA